MNLTDKQRIIISNALQDALELAKFEFDRIMTNQVVPCDSVEQMNNYRSFGSSYFYNLRNNAPCSHELIEFEHKH